MAGLRVAGLSAALLLTAGVAGAEVPDWLESRSFGWFTPSVYLNAAAGVSTEDHVEDLAVGHHDPTRKGGTVQGLELGLSMRANDYVEGFANYNLHYGYEKEWEGEWEEAFLKLANLPGGFEARGGRMLARYGARNSVHLHSWDFVDVPLAAGLFLGDGGLAIDGGDVTWAHRDRIFTVGVVGGYGEVVTHEHGHHDDHDDDHGHDSRGHAHGWEDTVGYGRIFGIYQPHDFVQWTAGVSAALGDNEDHETRAVYGVDLTYLWREGGLERGGRALRWTTELFVKSEKAEHEDDHREDGHGHHRGLSRNSAHDHGDGHHHGGQHKERETEFGAYTQLIYSWNEKLDTGLRLEFVEGGDHGHDRFRVSPVATYRPYGTPTVALRLQYNFDDLDHDQEHTVWAQLGLAWGGPEVR